jgi:hypothetical protein
MPLSSDKDLLLYDTFGKSEIKFSKVMRTMLKDKVKIQDTFRVSSFPPPSPPTNKSA